MDTNNWRSNSPSGEPTVDSGDWRSQLLPDSRQRIVNKIMDTLKRHLPFSGQEGLNELKKIAVRFEEKIFTAANSQSDYLRRISLKMLTMETKSQNTIPNAGNNNKPSDPDCEKETYCPETADQELQSMMPFEPTPKTTQMQEWQRQRQRQQEQQRVQLQYLHQLAKQQSPAKIKTHELLQPHQRDDADDVNMRQGIGVNPGVLQENLPTGQLPGYSYEHSKPGGLFVTSSPLLFQAPFVPYTSTLLTPSPAPGNSEKAIYSASLLSNISHQQATCEQAGSECPAPDTPGNGMSTMSIPPLLPGFKNANDSHGNDLKTGFGKINVTEQLHDPRVNMAKPTSLKSLRATVVTMVDEAATAVGEDLAAMRKRGLHARIFCTQTGMTGVDKIRCYVSALVILALIFWFIFNLNHE